MRLLKFILIIAIAGLALAGIFALKYTLTSTGSSAKSLPVVTVSSSTAKSTPWPDQITTIGTLSALNGVDITPQVSGIVSKISFTVGAPVEAGYPLVYLDDSMLQAQLNSANAIFNYKKVTYERYANLIKTGSVSDDQLDQARADMLQAQAAIDNLKAQIEQTVIRAPFAGRLGLSRVNLGQYVAAGTVLSTLQADMPLLIKMSLPANEIAKLSLGLPVQFTTDAFPDETYTGTLTAINAKIDPQALTIALQGQLANKNANLTPGLFGNVTIVLPTGGSALTVPQTAINYTLYGDSVYVIKTNPDQPQQKLATLTFVTLGERRGETVAITKGLKEGDEVVTSGLIKLQDGSPVTINNAVGF